MRFYVKLTLIVASFAGLYSATARRMLGNLAFEARVSYVYTFGAEADLQRLIEHAGRMRAIEDGCLEEYLARERFLQHTTLVGAPEDEAVPTPDREPIEQVADRPDVPPEPGGTNAEPLAREAHARALANLSLGPGHSWTKIVAATGTTNLARGDSAHEKF